MVIISQPTIKPHSLKKTLVTLKTGGGPWSNYIAKMMQMLLTMSHRIPTTYKGAVRGSWVWGCFAYSLHRAAAAGTTVWLWLRVSVLLSAQPRSRAYALSTNTMAKKLLNSYDINWIKNIRIHAKYCHMAFWLARWRYVCTLVYYWMLSRGCARMLSVQTQWLKSSWTHMISMLMWSIGK